MLQESMVFEVSEEYVKAEETAKNFDERVAPTIDDEVPSSQGGDLEQTNSMHLIDDAAPEDEDNM